MNSFLTPTTSTYRLSIETTLRFLLLNSAYSFGDEWESFPEEVEIRKQDTECCAQEISVPFEMQRSKSQSLPTKE